MENDKAVAAYTAHIDTIRMRLEALAEFTGNFGNLPPELVTWGAIGNAYYIAFRLGEVMDFLGIKED